MRFCRTPLRRLGGGRSEHRGLRADPARMFELVEPIATVSFSKVATETFLALGMRNYWDGYFAGRAAPLGLAPAYDVLSADELDELVAGLEPIAAAR
jgi:hypothetical protein